MRERRTRSEPLYPPAAMVGTARTAGLLARSIGWLCEERQARWAARVAVALIVIDAVYNASLLLSPSWRELAGYDATLDRESEVLILVTLLFHALAALVVLGRVGDLKPWPSYGFSRVGSWVFGTWFALAGALGIGLPVVSRVLTITEAALFLVVAKSPDPVDAEPRPR
jgi:hypothetical protein